MIGFLAWLVTNPVGRALIVFGAVGVSAALLWYSGRKSGVASVRARQQADAIKALKEKVLTDNEIRQMSFDDRRARLREWVRND